MPVGQALQEYVIEGLIGEGGFGIVYLARDTRLDRVVALKEYMPTNLAQRGSDRSVAVRSERHRETFVLGLRSFVNEAKLLASFDHPSLVKVYRFWEENGTAYMVMPFYEGPTLRQKLNELGQPPDEAWLRALLAPMIDALELIHNDHCWHRDIAPDNILLLAPQKTQAGPGPQLRPLLLDFGAARRVIGDVTHNLTVILKPGYAPLEQYAESESMRQGPWTDVYALCAVLYCAVTGRAPVPSVSRVLSDEMVSAAQAGAGRYSQKFLAAIDAGLAVRPDARPQSMAALREHFDLGPARTPQTTALPRSAAPTEGQSGSRRPGAAPGPTGPRQPTTARLQLSRSSGQAKASGEARIREGDAGAQKWPLIVAFFVLLVAAAAAFGWWLQRSTAPRMASPPSAQPTPQIAQPATPTVAPQPTPPAAPACGRPGLGHHCRGRRGGIGCGRVCHPRRAWPAARRRPRRPPRPCAPAPEPGGQRSSRRRHAHRPSPRRSARRQRGPQRPNTPRRPRPVPRPSPRRPRSTPSASSARCWCAPAKRRWPTEAMTTRCNAPTKRRPSLPIAPAQRN